MKIQPLAVSHIPEISEMIKGLEAWFDESAQRHIPMDLRFQRGFVAVDTDGVVGFVSCVFLEGALWIAWIGVSRNRRRLGIGAGLLEAVENLAREMGTSQIRTWTLGESVDYPPYNSTRQWYYKHGFRVYRRSKTDNPGCPEEIHLLKQLD